MSEGKVNAQLFGASALFGRTYHEGMELVEQTAAYLDGEGRQEARKLPKHIALAYTTESMRLTTRLMQMASWFLVQKAVSEGEMTPEQAKEEKYRLEAGAGCSGNISMSHAGEMPRRLQELIEQSLCLYHRVERLDRQLHIDSPEQLVPGISPLAEQFAKAEAFFRESTAKEYFLES